MTQTQSVQEHLAAVRDELKAAADKKDSEARIKVDAAVQHAQMAASQLKSRAGSDATAHHLDEVIKNGKKALDESGDALHARIDTMMTHAKDAIKAGKKS